MQNFTFNMYIHSICKNGLINYSMKIIIVHLSLYSDIPTSVGHEVVVFQINRFSFKIKGNFR